MLSNQQAFPHPLNQHQTQHAKYPRDNQNVNTLLSPRSSSHDQGEPSKKTSKDNSETIAPPKIQSHIGAALLSTTTRGRSRRSSTKPSIHHTIWATSSPCRNFCGRGHRGRGCCVDSRGVLGTAWVVRTACTLACLVIVACRNALGAELGAFEVWDRLGVVCKTRGEAVSTDAVVR